MLLDTGAARMIARSGVDTAADTTAAIAMNPKAFKVLSSTIYADKIGSMVRELYCNAVDSHIASGNPERPGVIHLPSVIEPWFSVQDFGVGMDDSTVRNVYMGYFTSTKDGANDQIGAFGLGSKTPYAYTDAFTVRAVKDGMVRFYIMFLSERGVPTISLVDESTTDEGNGVTVTVPVVDNNDFSNFRTAVEQQLRFMRPRPVIENGSVTYPDYYDPLNKIVGDGYSIGIGHGNLFVVQGGVGYPIDRYQVYRVLNGQPFNRSALAHLYNTGAIIEVPIGDIEVTASRESVEYTKRTCQNIIKAAEKAAAAVKGVFFKELDAIDNPWDFYTKVYNVVSHDFIFDYDLVSEKGAKLRDKVFSIGKNQYGRHFMRLDFETLFPKISITDANGGIVTHNPFRIGKVTRRYSRSLGDRAQYSSDSVNNIQPNGVDRTRALFFFMPAENVKAMPRRLTHLAYGMDPNISNAVNQGNVFYFEATSRPSPVTFAEFVAGIGKLGIKPEQCYNLADVVLPKAAKSTNVGAPNKKYKKAVGYKLVTDLLHKVDSIRQSGWNRLEADGLDGVAGPIFVLTSPDAEWNVPSKVLDPIIHKYGSFISKQENLNIILVKEKDYADLLEDERFKAFDGFVGYVRDTLRNMPEYKEFLQYKVLANTLAPLMQQHMVNYCYSDSIDGGGALVINDDIKWLHNLYIEYGKLAAKDYYSGFDEVVNDDVPVVDSDVAERVAKITAKYESFLMFVGRFNREMMGAYWDSFNRDMYRKAAQALHDVAGLDVESDSVVLDKAA